jgi:hypothetical protein
VASGGINLDEIFEPFTGPGRVLQGIQDVSTSPISEPLSPSSGAAGGSRFTGTTTNIAPNTSIARVPDSVALNGPRNDLPSLWGVRVRIGLLSDGSYGVERYTINGIRQVPTWS